jgi:hypothetical protein
MLVDNTTCQQLVSRNVNAGKTGSSSFTSIAWWWNLGDGKGRFSDKVIKIPSRRGQMLYVIS